MENLFEDTTTRDSSGWFAVELPTKSLENIGETVYIAKTRFKYLDLGLMTKIPKIHYFLPHHPVFKLDSSTTKLRVIFDASAKTSTNMSLMNGPQIQDNLFSILIRCRFSRYLFSVDLTKTFK